jgi:hypothetical protein
MGKRSKIRQRAPIGAKEGHRLRAALGVAQRRLRQLGEEREAAQLEMVELRRVVADQTRQMKALAERVEFVMGREKELRAMLLGAHDQLMRRTERIRADLAAELQQPAPHQDASSETHSLPEVPVAVRPAEQTFASSAYTGHQQRGGYPDYPWLVRHIREVANAVLPPEATVAVVSKGDEELLELGGGRRGWHFPQNDDGVYAGYYPADGAEAIIHLEELRTRGAGFLLFPETAFWWLERYGDLKQHLEARYRRIWSEKCIIYQLHEPSPNDAEIR